MLPPLDQLIPNPMKIAENVFSSVGNPLWLIDTTQRLPAKSMPVLLDTETFDNVAIVNIEGVLGPKDGMVRTDKLVDVLGQIHGDGTIKRVLLNIDSPGGSAALIDEAHAAVVELAQTKQVVAQISGVGASAAYYIASGADQIFASTKTDMVGSIGTRLLLYDFSKAFANFGVEAVTIDTGPHKSAGAFGSEITEEQRDHLQSLVDTIQEDFTMAVSNGRGLAGERLEAVTDGRIFLASDAQSMGLIDGIQPMSETLRMLSPKKEEKTMSQENEASAPAVKRGAEIVKDLALLPGVTDEFRCAAVDNDWTFDQAQSAWMEKLMEKADTAEQSAKEAEEKAKTLGSQQRELEEVGDDLSNGSPTEDDPITAYEKVRDSYLQGIGSKYVDRMEAMKACHDENKDLCFAMCKENRERFGTHDDPKPRPSFD